MMLIIHLAKSIVICGLTSRIQGIEKCKTKICFSSKLKKHTDFLKNKTHEEIIMIRKGLKQISLGGLDHISNPSTQEAGAGGSQEPCFKNENKKACFSPTDYYILSS
jgi:hypothetical protein